jgi:hypothetical protein
LRWLGSRTVAATGRFAPIVIEAGTFGFAPPPRGFAAAPHPPDPLDGRADVRRGRGPRRREGPRERLFRADRGGRHVDYFHLLFDSHQIVWSEGLETESFLPGPSVMNEFEEDVREEVLALFPEIDPDSYEGYGPSARPSLKAFEARALGAGY